MRVLEQIGERPLPTRAASVPPSQLVQGAQLDAFNTIVARDAVPMQADTFGFIGDVLKAAAPVAGAVGGFILGGPAGAMAGASLGGALAKGLSGDTGGLLAGVAQTALQQTGIGQTIAATGAPAIAGRILAGDVGGAAAAAVRQFAPQPAGGAPVSFLDNLIGPVFGGGPATPQGGSTLGDLQAAATDLFSGNFLGALQQGGAAAVSLFKPAPARPGPAAFVGPPNPFTNPPAIPTSIPFKEPPPMLGTTFSVGGPMGISFSSGAPSRGLTVPQGYTAGNLTTVAQVRHMLMQQASQTAGFRISWHKLFYLLMHYGLQIVKQLTGLDESAILWLEMNRPHRGRRGPYLRTIEKRVRQAQSYRHRVAKVAHALGLHATHRSYPPLPSHKRPKARKG